MATEERDSTADWIVPDERRPPSVLELQRQIDVAMAVARAAEEAALEMSEASLEAARAARDAAVHAERSAEAAAAAARAAAEHASSSGSELPVGWTPVAAPSQSAAASPPAAAPVAAARPARTAQPDPLDERMIAFRDRAERLMARLQRLDAAPPVS